MTAPAYPAHPLEASDRLAWQATAAVGLLERFGDLVMVALDAVGSRDDEALAAALAERERLMAQLQPLLADLATARLSASELELAGPYSRRAVATILGPVDEALRYANLLHARLTDEVSEQAQQAQQAQQAPVARPRPRRAALALVR